MLRLADPERSNSMWQDSVLLGCEVLASIYLGSVKSPSCVERHFGYCVPLGLEVNSRLPERSSSVLSLLICQWQLMIHPASH